MVKSSRFWTDEETEFMLSHLKKVNILKYMDGRKTRNANLFKKVAEQLKDAGFKRTPEQIRSRWKHLKHVYLNAQKSNFKSDNSPESVPFRRILEELLGRQSLSEVAEHGVDIGFSPSVSECVQGTGGPEETMEERATSSAGPRLTPVGGRRRGHSSSVEAFLQRLQQMQDTWMEQIRQSQDRDERMVNSLLKSNESMMSALMDGMRRLQSIMPPHAAQGPHPGMDTRVESPPLGAPKVMDVSTGPEEEPGKQVVLEIKKGKETVDFPHPPRDISTGLKEEPNNQQDLCTSDQDFVLEIKNEETVDFPDPPRDIFTGLKEEPSDDWDIYAPIDVSGELKEEPNDQQYLCKLDSDLLQSITEQEAGLSNLIKEEDEDISDPPEATSTGPEEPTI